MISEESTRFSKIRATFSQRWRRLSMAVGHTESSEKALSHQLQFHHRTLCRTIEVGIEQSSF